jgi:hypothetical protein
MEMVLQAPGLSSAKAATVAGSLYVITMATSMIAEIACFSPLIVRGNVSQTAANIIAHETQFRAGIALMLVTTLAVVPLFWGLYVIVRNVNKDIALLALIFRIAETAFIGAALINQTTVLRYLGKGEYLTVFENAQLYALMNISMNSYGSGLYFGFVSLGAGSTLFAWLFYRSGYVPRIIGGWGIIASLLIGFACLSQLVYPGLSPFVYPYAMVPMFFYEVGLGLWLWIKGVNVIAEESR